MKTTLAFLLTALAIFLTNSVGVGWSAWTLASALLTAAVLLAARLHMKPAPIATSIGVIALLYWGLSYTSNIIEAVYFHVLPLANAGTGVVAGAIIALIAAGVLVFALPPKPASVGADVSIASGLWWRLPVLCLCFFFIYVAAGAAILPWIKAFYADKPLPSLSQLFVLQCLRGLFDLACFYPWLLLYRGTRTRAAMLSAAIFTVLCGWGPLLLPNQYLPATIRLAHAAEMGASGIVFGILTVLILLKSTRGSMGS